MGRRLPAYAPACRHPTPSGPPGERANRRQHIAYDLYTNGGLTRSLTFPWHPPRLTPGASRGGPLRHDAPGRRPKSARQSSSMAWDVQGGIHPPMATGGFLPMFRKASMELLGESSYYDKDAGAQRGGEWSEQPYGFHSGDDHR